VKCLGLITSLTFTNCWTGSSAIFSPLRIFVDEAGSVAHHPGRNATRRGIRWGSSSRRQRNELVVAAIEKCVCPDQ
jgi:hypothetical protein